jgi:hypothetical protein
MRVMVVVVLATALCGCAIQRAQVAQDARADGGHVKGTGVGDAWDRPRARRRKVKRKYGPIIRAMAAHSRDDDQPFQAMVITVSR